MVSFAVSLLFVISGQFSFAEYVEPDFTSEQAMKMEGLAEFRAKLLDCVKRSDSKCLIDNSVQDPDFGGIFVMEMDRWECKKDPKSKNDRSNTKEFATCVFKPANKELKERLKYVLGTQKIDDFTADHPKSEKFPRVFILHESGMRGIFIRSDKGWKLFRFGTF